MLSSGLLERVVTSEVLSEDFSPGLLTPIVASSTKKMSYPPSLIRETTSAIRSESANDSLIASPSSFIICFSCWSTWPPSPSFLPPSLLNPASLMLFALFSVPLLRPDIVRRKPDKIDSDKIDSDGQYLHYTQAGHPGTVRGPARRKKPHVGCRLERRARPRGALGAGASPA